MKKTLLSLVLLLAIVVSTAFSYNWSNQGTFSLSSGNSWKKTTTTGNTLSAVKTTNNSGFEVYTHSKTMWSYPSVRMVNSNNEIRSSSVMVSPVGEYSVGSNNTGSKGYRYYLSIKPAWNQISKDTIKLSYTPR